MWHFTIVVGLLFAEQPDAVLENAQLKVTVEASGVFSVLDKRAGIVWRSTKHISPFRNLQKPSNEKLAFQTDARQRDGKTFPIKVAMWLEGDELVIEVDTDDLKGKVGTFAALPPLPPFSVDCELLLPYYGNGIAVPVASKEFRGWSFTTFGSLDMPWVGVTDGKVGYLLLWDGRSADDGNCIIEVVKTSQGELLTPAAFHNSTMQAFVYPRRVRYIFAADGGYVALCKRYREYAKRNGFLVTLTEKAKRKPDVKLLAGAPNVWGSNPQFAREAKAAGIDRLLINGIWAAREMEAIKAMGYLNSRYDNYEDLYTCCPQHSPPYNIGTIEDCVLRADGNRQVGWVTWDKKHTSHKRCSLLQLDVAKKYIADQISRHPHNAWFLDVTTATWLIECYDQKHPHDRTQDKEEKRRLAKFVGDELGLVLGGEHGRWWGVDIYDYWEGMMSINPFFTWAAGHLRPPEKREEIGERYLEWGLGHKRRLPLWELVFHDCVVSYWYWGDSTDFLYRVAPELSDKKDAFNILYGTPPMFWVNKLGFTWNDPKMRKRLLQSYRIVCKLHEQIAFDEMLLHEWLTQDRDVQRTIFGRAGSETGVTEVVVNFGEKPFTLIRKCSAAASPSQEQKFVLPQFGFYAHGPRIMQYRALAGERTVTFICTPDYAFCDASGKRYDFGLCATDGQITLRLYGKEQIQVIVEMGTTEVVLRPKRFTAGFDSGSAKLLELDEQGVPKAVVQFARIGDALRFVVPKGGATYTLLWGSRAKQPNFTVGSINLPLRQIRQGQQVKVSIQVLNNGGADGEAKVSLYLDKALPGHLLGSQVVSIKANGQRTVVFTFATDAIDGEHLLIIQLESMQPKSELVEGDNIAQLPFAVQPDYSRWRFSADITVSAGGIRRLDEPISLEVDFGKLGEMPQNASVDIESVRVMEVEGGRLTKAVPTHFEPSKPDSQQGTLVFLLTGVTPPNAVRQFRIFWNATKPKRQHFPMCSSLQWDDKTRTITTPFYRLRFGDDGMVREWVSLMPNAPRQSFLQSIGVSSAQTGWVDEVGEVEVIKCLSVNPVSVIVQVVKRLRGDFRIIRTFSFYLRHFVVEIEANKKGISTYSRAYYLLPCNFEDDKGNKAFVDGRGDGENVIGKNPQPKWYAVYSDDWAHSCVAISQFDNLTYWDSPGAWGGVGFNTGQTKDIQIAYVLHEGQKDASFAIWDYERLTKTAKATIMPK
ncbi:MAG: glycoside hydrolase [Armatimonadota bacterium]|nr:glycoside hydrolase [Armatimonadota bacterium]MCX7778140.1 glycoside hydrolase [Armatimonadota bacterium]MDW8024852.1 glycoside hydrolase [Armatimonadota bacterium]